VVRPSPVGWAHAYDAPFLTGSPVKAKLSVQAVSALEQGTCGPTWETVLRLAHALDVNLEDFRMDPKSMKWSESEGGVR
jgi:transcriptional regulator with XRE-family HTH domain